MAGTIGVEINSKYDRILGIGRTSTSVISSILELGLKSPKESNANLVLNIGISLKTCTVRSLQQRTQKRRPREDGHLKLINVFEVITWNYRKVLPYKIPCNDNRKMRGKVYTEEILSQLLDDLQGIRLF
jgi:hypothetical protein